MSHINNTNSAKIDGIIESHFSRKNKKTRQSQPNFMIEDLQNQSLNCEEQGKEKSLTNKRMPRMSQAPSPTFNADGFHSPQHKNLNQNTHNGFLSPLYLKKTSPVSKLINVASYKVQTDPLKLILKNTNIKPQTKNRKNPIQSHKQTLNKIEQLLHNHGINIPSTKNNENSQVKMKKSPRQSESSMQQNSAHVHKKNRKLNQSNSKPTHIEHGGQKLFPIVDDEQLYQMKQLKQTVSTLSSHKNSKQIKITDFQLGRELGKGKFGVVRMARHKKTNTLFSIKIIKKQVIKQQQLISQLIKQIKIQSFLSHPNIAKLYTIFDDALNIYLVEELCCQGNLYQLMQKKAKNRQKFTEVEAKNIIKSVCQGVFQLHRLNIIHRDIKPQNVVLCYSMAKIIDFGWSTQYKDVMRVTFCGTPLYVSPQLLSGNCYDEKVDLWAIGVLSYQLLTGNIPFEIKSQKDLTKIVNESIAYPKTLTPISIQFLQNLLLRDPKKRKSIQQLLDHPFLNPIGSPTSSSKLAEKQDTGTCNKITPHYHKNCNQVTHL